MQYSIRLRRHWRAFHQIFSALIFIVATLPSPIPLAFANSTKSANTIDTTTTANTKTATLISANPSRDTIAATSNSPHSSSVPMQTAPTSSEPQPIISTPITRTSTAPNLDPAPTSTPTSTPNSTSTSTSIPTSAPTPPLLHITGRTLPIFTVNHTLTDSGDAVAKYGDKFLYGHNTSSVFGSLQHLKIGSRFSITTSQTTVNYIIRHSEIMTKSETSDFMWAIAHADFRGQTYDLSIMTCAGQSRPGRDATHRLIIFANRI